MLRTTGFLLLLLWSLIIPIEEGVLELRVTDVTGQVIRNLGITCGAQCSTAYSDDAGRARLKLPPEKRSDDWVFLEVVKGSGNGEWVLISPWDFRLNVPSFANKPENIAVVTIARKGDRQLLSSGRAVETMTARIVKQLKVKLEREVSDEERRLVLQQQADSFGLTPQEVDTAIREWGRKAEDPYQQGLAALYEKNYPRAVELLTRSYDLRKAEMEQKINEFVDATVFLGDALYAQSKFREAAAKYEEASSKRPTDGVILNSLAMALFAAGDLQAAERAGERAVSAKMSDRGFGPRSPQLAGAQFELARIYFEQRKYPQAETLLKQALEINEQQLGPQDASVENCLRAYARVLYAMKRYEEGQKAEIRANEIKNKLTRDKLERDLINAQADFAAREQELGAEAPALEPSVRKLAFAYFYLQKYAEAEPLFQRALALKEKALGLEHPDVADSVMDLARVYQRLQKFPQAEAACLRALAILEKVVEKDHFRLLPPLRGLAEIYGGTDRLPELKTMEERIRAIEKKYPQYNQSNKRAS